MICHKSLQFLLVVTQAYVLINANLYHRPTNASGAFWPAAYLRHSPLSGIVPHGKEPA
jgi:hypothetical protein